MKKQKKIREKGVKILERKFAPRVKTFIYIIDNSSFDWIYKFIK